MSGDGEGGQAPDRELTAAELLSAAGAALDDDRPRAAHELYARALETAGDSGARADALEGLGHVAHRSGRPREALPLLEKALSVACLLGYALTDRGKFAEAETVLVETLAAGAGIDDPIVQVRLLWAEARLRGEQGKTEIAADRAWKALELLRTTDEQHLLGLTHELLGSLYNDLGRYEEAQSLLRDGWPILINNATPLQVAHYRIEEARALAGLGQHEGAAALAMRVAAQLDGTHPGDAGRAYLLLGEIFDGLGEVARARQLYETGITLLRNQGPSRYLATAYKRLGELFEAEYRAEDAVEVLKRALSIQQGIETTFAAPE